MKISKLFHWLYAFLMLMPVFAVGVKCLYVVFNSNANQSYRGDYSFASNVRLNQIVSSNATTTEEVVVNNNSYYKYTNLDFNNSFSMNSLSGVGGSTFSNMVTGVPAENVIINDVEYSNIKFILYYRVNTTRTFKYYDIEFNDNYYIFYSNNNAIIKDLNGDDVSAIKIDNKFGPADIEYNLSYYNSTNTIYGIGSSMDDIINKYFYTDLFIVDTTLSSVFYSSIQELDSNSFFGWARHSFIAEPFLYIGNLFGIEEVHPIFTFLSYWAVISIIYLVFDLIMYVPLLAHRWIDKGMIE